MVSVQEDIKYQQKLFTMNEWNKLAQLFHPFQINSWEKKIWLKLEINFFAMVWKWAKKQFCRKPEKVENKNSENMILKKFKIKLFKWFSLFFGHSNYEPRPFASNLIQPQQTSSIVKYCYQHCLTKEIIKMLFTVHYLLLLSSFAFQTLLIRVITFQIDKKRMLWPATKKMVS